MRAWACAVICASTLGCGQPMRGEAKPRERPVHVAPAAEPVALDVFLREGARAAGLDRAGTIALLGTPDSIAARAVANRHDPSLVDSVVALHYPDAAYHFYIVTAADRDLLDLADIAGDAHLRHTPPRIGTPADSLRAWYGAPAQETAAHLIYECASCPAPLPGTFVIANGRVHRIRFDYYVD